MVSVSARAAIELYNSPFVPAEFSDFEGACRVVVIWTKWKLGLRQSAAGPEFGVSDLSPSVSRR